MNAEKFRACRGVLFDFGGTLDSDGEHWLDRFYALYGQAGLDFPLPEIKRAFYRADELCCRDAKIVLMGLRPLMEHHVHLQFEALDFEDAGKEKELSEAFCAKSEKFLGRNARLLERVRRNFKLGLVSNFYGNVATLCKEAGLAKSLDVILDSVQVGISKPDPGIFLSALRSLDLSPTQVIFVGDSYERDMIPARDLGMRTVWLKGPNPKAPVNAGSVDDCISSLAELDELVS